jgi:hypothetical protein
MAGCAPMTCTYWTFALLLLFGGSVGAILGFIAGTMFATSGPR